MVFEESKYLPRRIGREDTIPYLYIHTPIHPLFWKDIINNGYPAWPYLSFFTSFILLRALRTRTKEETDQIVLILVTKLCSDSLWLTDWAWYSTEQDNAGNYNKRKPDGIYRKLIWSPWKQMLREEVHQDMPRHEWSCIQFFWIIMRIDTWISPSTLPAKVASYLAGNQMGQSYPMNIHRADTLSKSNMRREQCPLFYSYYITRDLRIIRGITRSCVQEQGWF